MGLLAFRTNWGRAPTRVAAMVSAVQRVGITTRMIMSFAAVALLAGTANMIARESVHIIRTVTHAREIKPIPRAVPMNAQPASTEAQLATLQKDLERFREAVRQRVDTDSTVTAANYADAKRALQSAVLAIPRSRKERETDWTQRLAALFNNGKDLIQLADERRQARGSYTLHTRAASERIAQSLQGAWTVFGRVITRKSLLQLRGELDSMKMRADGLIAGEMLDRQQLALLTAAETAFAASLDTNQASLRKSEGDAWFNAVAADFAALVKSREFMQESNARLAQARQQFQELIAALEIATLSHAETAKRAAAAAAGAASYAPAIPAADSVVETTVERNDPGAARLMELVTVLVMLIIIAISVLTVRSIVLPVRRLVRATRQLADGGANVRVGRGGIKELDVVAKAFDQMAEQLESMRSAYRHQQEDLEDQVLERTYRLQRLAQQDPLTSLPNRRHLSSLLSAALTAARHTGRHVGVYFLDIDNFKNINDSLGHVFGDRVLMSVANRLEEVIDGVGFVARLGGDEFTLVYENANSGQQLHEFGGLLMAAFDKLVSVDDREISIRVSVGVSAFPEHDSEPDGLLRAADSALFRAKELGRNQLAVFTPELTASAATRFAIEQGLRLALKRDEFELAYQPEIHLGRGEVALVEALIRWRQADGRLAMPSEFLGVAEQSGLMAEINAWVLQTAFRDASRWHHGGWPETRVAINISARQLVDRLFVEQILRLLDKWRLPAKCIELELTESVLQTGASTIEALRTLRSHGFGIALDDFGTGYSSLTSLEQLPLSRVKLDANLVASIGSSPRAASIARAIIDLCAGLGLEVTAEGIERAEQFAWFARNSSVCLQGFLFSEAIPFAGVLPFKTALGAKLNDLLLSLPAPARSTSPEGRCKTGPKAAPPHLGVKQS